MKQTSVDKQRIKFLLLEGVHDSAEALIRDAGYNNIEREKASLDGQALCERVKDVHFLGIRSRTQLTAEVFDAAPKLNAVGCFCIGTNQVDLKAALEHGVAVFNAPFSNTRSVAELVLAEAILLLRGVPAKNARPAETSTRTWPMRRKCFGYRVRHLQRGIMTGFSPFETLQPALC